jgi:catechol 2,3-dioxygenase-like lactoylglutathione lyase family enzyme
MPTSIAFYRDVLGFEVVTTSKPGAENFDWALLRLNGTELILKYGLRRGLPSART